MTPTDKLPLRESGEGLDLLKGVRVLDLTTSVAGPYAGQLLGDLGADVLKIERPGPGDDARSWGPPFLEGESLWFLAVNRNKRSLALDYTSEPGLGVFMQLVGTADVVLVNQLVRVQEKLGVDAKALREVKPGLIHVSITGFGLAGARRDQPCYDLIAEGYSGVMDLTGDPDSPPQKVGTPAADLLAGQDAAMAALAALLRRSRTGEGCTIDVALIDSMTRFMAPRIMAYLGSGDVPRRSGGKDSVIAIYQTFDTADRPITLGLGNDRIWEKFWESAGNVAFGSDRRFATNAGRREHREQIVERIQKILTSKPRSAWLQLFAAAGVPAGPINSLDEVCADSQLLERGLLFRVASPGGIAALPQVGLGIGFDGKRSSLRRAPPRLGNAKSAPNDWLGPGGIATTSTPS